MPKRSENKIYSLFHLSHTNTQLMFEALYQSLIPLVFWMTWICCWKASIKPLQHMGPFKSVFTAVNINKEIFNL